MPRTYLKILKNFKIISGSGCSLIRLIPSGKWPSWSVEFKGWKSGLLTLLLLTLLGSCKTDYQNLPAFSEQKQLQVVILTPAGSNHPKAYDNEKKIFVSAQDAGMPEQVKFLPYPGNFGFIPSTFIKNAEAAEGTPLGALVLAESVPTGTVTEVIPIATLLLDVAGEVSYVVVTVPARPSEQVIAATDFASFSLTYPAAKEIIQKWFTNHHPNQPTRLMGWQDEQYTEKLIRRWLR